MKKTFTCNESIVITIPLRSLKNAREGELLPGNFHCVFQDNFKILVLKGKPKPVGSAQAVAGLFLLILTLIDSGPRPNHVPNLLFFIPSFLFIICGIVSCAAGKFPNMHVTKLSFSLNILNFLSSLTAFCLCILFLVNPIQVRARGLDCLKVSLLVLENMIALFLIYWLSKAVCREHFNTLPIVLLKEED